MTSRGVLALVTVGVATLAVATLAVATVGVATPAARPRHARRRVADPADPRRLRLLPGPVLDRYLAEGGPAGALGPPVTALRRATADPATPLGADHEVVFAYGAMYLDSSVGRTTILLWGCGNAERPRPVR